jgi:hypothetical protein
LAKEAFNKLRSNPEVLSLVDTARELKHTADRMLDAGLAVFRPAFWGSLRELPSYLQQNIAAIAEAGRTYTNAFNETDSHRAISAEFRKLNADQTKRARTKEHNEILELLVARLGECLKVEGRLCRG